jgi:hypothetical protein
MVLKTSKHCSQCDKCIESFDHHCKFLNNCIGKRNYRLFIVLITLIELQMIGEMLCQGYFICQYAKDKESVIDSMAEVYGDDIGEKVANFHLATVIIVLTINVASWIGNTYLVIFHSYITCKGISTYDYIMKERR